MTVTEVVTCFLKTIAISHSQQEAPDLQSTAIFKLLSEHLSSNPEIVRKVKAIFTWNITKNGKTVAKWSESIKSTTF